ncbi:acyl-CoA desaturase [Sorangium sp. So ce1014]|uniref:acyl-CoA desaturase n=1 Tax=Sorangium sp. So ce1014 TaxID=3133326 RepID=UPI003F60EA05
MTPGQCFNVLGIAAIHAGAVLALVRGVTWELAALAAVAYLIRLFAMMAGYHRYFSHRTFKTSRAFQFLLALVATTAAQKGPLWWASTHRVHHKYSDTDRDVHSPTRRSFWHAHMGWWMGREHEATDLSLIADFARYPELRWLDRWHALSIVAMVAALLIFGGLDVGLWGYCVSTCLLHHVIYAINSVAHVSGSRRYATTDTSRNNPLLGVLCLGEGWHNNHHHYQSSARQGFFWWEIDMTYYGLKALEKIGLVWDVRGVPEHALRRNLVAETGESCELVPEETSAIGGDAVVAQKRD